MSTQAMAISGAMHWLERSVARAANWLLDLVFPPACGNCGRVDFRFCASCLHELEQVPVEVSAGRSQVPNELDALIASGPHQGILRNAVQAFKYDGARELALTLAARLVKPLRSVEWQIDAVVPVPLFADREAERGYNQSALLSQQVALAMGVAPRADYLRRTRETRQQARLSQAEQQLNVRDAFEASNDVEGLSILLVDDVVTTGSTFRECAAALRAKRVGKVYGIAVSHT